MDQKTKRLSVVVPMYNAGQYIERCVDSIVSQGLDCSEYEIIVINDGSTDNSYEITKKLSQKYNNIYLYTQENKGQGVARNFGMKKSEGRFIWFLDADDYLLPNILKRVLAFAEEKRLDICMTLIEIMDKDGHFHTLEIPEILKGTVIDGNNFLTEYTPSSACATLFSRSFVMEKGIVFADGIMHEDVLFVRKLFSYAKRVSVLDLSTYVYYFNSNSTDRKIDKDKLLRSIKSDLYIAREFKEFSNSAHLTNWTRNDFVVQANSITMSVIFSLIMRCHELEKEEKIKIIAYVEKCNLIPLTGKMNSLKGYAFKCLLGYPAIIKTIIRFL